MRRLWVTLILVAVATGCQRDPADEPASPRPPNEQQAPAAVPEARTEVGAGRLGDRIAVVGGLLADGSATPRVDLYDLGTGRWQAGPDLPDALHHAGVAAFRGRLFVAGGYTQTTAGAAWAESARVFSLGAGDEQWRTEPSLSLPRGALGLAATDGFLVAFGGTSGGQVVGSVEILDAGGDRWRAGPAMNRPREHTAAAESQGRIYAIAGRVGGLETNLDAVESLDPAATGAGAGWRVEPALGKARGGIAAATVGGTICVAGGEEPGATIAGVECLIDGQWRTITNLATPRHGLGVVAGNGRALHVLAGGPQPGLFVSDAHEIIAIGR